ncbi:hypothetical protein JRC04_05465 [Mycolicibacterium sp. S2-37]|uniref:hypothetical protein n=1 Tax=Mycolicibacterium sp. S2-37 TaxID=2810297 RepID=UPI001A943410|nr:hypothetical protein [Mycolicibacterium sp. S2-37]MBO0676904.1 hypothetical protein [Mycolicibacterium sp. S2-37]
MTQTLVAPADLSAYEFDIPCQWIGCNEPALVMCKGCSDRAHSAICKGHLKAVQDRFWAHKKARVCDGCNRPWLFFELHYDLVVL